MRPYQRVFGIFVAALALGGCVSTSEYEKLQVDNAALKQQLAAAERDKAHWQDRASMPRNSTSPW
jgi:hypothetical protein